MAAKKAPAAETEETDAFEQALGELPDEIGPEPPDGGLDLEQEDLAEQLGLDGALLKQFVNSVLASG